MPKPNVLIFGVISILLTVGLWFIQNLAMYTLSPQYRDVGYIEYGSFLRMNGIVPQLAIIFVPLVGSVLIFIWCGKLANRSLRVREYRVLVWLLSGFLLIVLVIRTAIISIQGYALIFI